MCKPSCCPGNNSGSGLGIALAALAGLVLVSAAARPIIHAVEVIAQVALITAAAVLALALTVLVTVVIVRVRSARRPTVKWLPGQLASRSTMRVVDPPAPTWARAAIATRIRTLPPPVEADTADIEWWS